MATAGAQLGRFSSALSVGPVWTPSRAGQSLNPRGLRPPRDDPLATLDGLRSDLGSAATRRAGETRPLTDLLTKPGEIRCTCRNTRDVAGVPRARHQQVRDRTRRLRPPSRFS